MKPLKLATLFAPVLLLAGCTTSPTGAPVNANSAIGTASNVGMAVFQSEVGRKCRSELTNNNYWKMASLAMNEQKRTDIQNNVCGCVSKRATESVSLVDLTTAAIDSNSRNQIVAQAVANTMQGCYREFVR